MDTGGGELTRPRPGTDADSRVMRIGITGHMDIGPETMRLVADALRMYLLELDETRTRGMVGVSCLAPGADRIFADVLLDLGGRLEVIMPLGEYSDETAQFDDGPVLGELLRRAESVRAIESPQGRPQAYVATNEAILDSIDSLVAVWNGVTSEKPGGTAHMVRTARSRRIPVTVIWPEGAKRQG